MLVDSHSERVDARHKTRHDKATSQIQHQPRRVLQALLHPHQERHRLAAVDDARPKFVNV
jgi:DNA-binding TFAR19-related protein (PDSD5 family)